MVRRIKVRHLLLPVVAGTLLLFQNCSSNTTDQAMDATSLSYEEQLPFAFDAKPDTIAYMSCGRMTGSGWSPKAYFNFRVGAYQTNLMGQPSMLSGLGLTDQFLTQTRNFTVAERTQALATSKLSASTMMQLSVRKVTDYQDIWHLGDKALGSDVDSFLGLKTLDSTSIAGHLAGLQAGQYLNYFSGSEPQRLMEASLRFLESDVANRDLRNLMSNQNERLLVLGYTEGADILGQALRGPSGPTAQKIFGKGYKLRFETPVGYSVGENRRLAGVSEIDLSTGLPGAAASWDCPTTLQFMVIRPEDYVSGWVKVSFMPDYSTNATQADQLAKIRRVLHNEDWYVDLATQSVIPKGMKDFCYGDRTGRPRINYFGGSCTGDPSDSCPHYVTICIRKP